MPRFSLTIDRCTLENGCLEIVPRRHREGLIGEEWHPLPEVGFAAQPIPTEPGDAIFFDSFVPHASKPNFTNEPRRVLYLTYNLAEHGDHRARYYIEKHVGIPAGCGPRRLESLRFSRVRESFRVTVPLRPNDCAQRGGAVAGDSTTFG
jgi:hypothetical protein